MDLETMECLDSYESEKRIIDLLFEHESGTRQCQLIVDWLEKNMQDKLDDMLDTEHLQFHTSSLYWEHTAHDLSQIRMGSKDPSLASNLVTELDPDAPIRQQRSLSSLDQQDEQQLLQYVFMFIRAGKLEEAQRLCVEQGHSWRAATLDGWRLWHDPNFSESLSGEILPAEGNPYRDLWKSNCWAMSKENCCGVHEKAIYAALSGNLDQLLPACSNWEDCLWAYFKVIVDIRVEQELRNRQRADRSLQDLPQEYWDQANGESLTPQAVFEHLEAHPNMAVRKQCCEAYHVFQKNIILNEIGDLLKEMKQALCGGNVHMIRFMAHLVLFLRTVGVQTHEEICVAVLERYIQVLIEIKQYDLVAFYTAQLPPDLQVEVYAKFLQEVNAKGEKQKFLELAEEAGLDLPFITKQIVESIRDKNIEATEHVLDVSGISEVDQQKIDAVEWLTFDASQRAEALRQANAIARNFLAVKKLEAAARLYSQIPSDSIDVIYKQWRQRAGDAPLLAEDDNAIKEFLCVRAYLDAHDAFNSWFEHFHHQAPPEPKLQKRRNFKDQIVYEQERKEYEAEFERWQKTLSSHVKLTSDRIYNVLLFPGGWLSDHREDTSDGNELRLHQMELLRRMCIPFLSFLLHSVLYSAKQYKQCFQLAEVIQSKRHKLHEVFQKSELQKLLELLREASLALLDQGLDPLGYPKGT